MARNNKVSVIIPARKEPYLLQTLNDLYAGAAGSIEVLVVLDGWVPEYEIPERPGLKILSNTRPRGLRYCLNKAAEVVTGKYLMKIDAHCTIDEGWDAELKAECEDNWIVVPRRYWFDAPTWTVKDKPHVDAMAYFYPFIRPYYPRLTARPWEARKLQRADVLLDEDMSYQGSCYFMQTSLIKRIGGWSEYGYGTFSSEPEEIGLQLQLGPLQGAIMRNKKTWYAHWSKPQSHWRAKPEDAGRCPDDEREAGNYYCFDFWFNNRWDKRLHDFEWLVDKFWPIENWPDNWCWLTQEYKRYDLKDVMGPCGWFVSA